MSRIRVLNLPNSITIPELRSHFSKLPRGEIVLTDSRVIRNDQGCVRMAFVGFHNAATGAQCVQHFNGSFFGTRKLVVEIALGRNHRWCEGGNDTVDNGNTENQAKSKRPHRYMPQPLKESLECDSLVPSVRRTSGDCTSPQVRSAPHIHSNNKRPRITSPRPMTISDAEPVEPNHLPRSSRKSDPLAGQSKRACINHVTCDNPTAPIIRDLADADAEALQRQRAMQAVSDEAFLVSRIVTTKRSSISSPSMHQRMHDSEQRDRRHCTTGDEVWRQRADCNGAGDAEDVHFPGASEDGDVDDDRSSAHNAQTDFCTAAPPPPPPSTTCRIRVTNIPHIATEYDVKNFFTSHLSGHSIGASVQSTHLPLTRDTKQSKGFAFVTFSTPSAVEAAVRMCDKAVFMGRLMHVEVAHPPREAKKKESLSDTWKSHTLETSTAPESQCRNEKTTGPDIGSSCVASSSFEEQDKAAGPSDRQTWPNQGVAARKHNIHDIKAHSGHRRGGPSGDGPVPWNPLYMSASVAVHTVAARADTEASQLITVDRPGAAVDTAIAEAVLTHEAKGTLGDENIDFSAVYGGMGSPQHRSNRTILAKHIPPESSLEEIHELFARYGRLDKVVVPRDVTFAIVAFIHEQDAQRAFARLAFRPFRQVPLYLEWAPLGVLKDLPDPAPDAATPLTDLTHSTNADPQTGNTSPNCTAYLTNLPFHISRDDFERFLMDCAPRLTHQPQLLKRMTLQSTEGRAFVSLADEASLTYVLHKVQGRSLEGRVVDAQPARTTQGTPTDHNPGHAAASEQQEGSLSAPKGCNPLKIVIKNLPFEATESELRQLCGTFAELRAVRVPKRVHRFAPATGGQGGARQSHRGFAFVEFLTAQDAAHAMQTLSSTHFYGRHLVLQYATL